MLLNLIVVFCAAMFIIMAAIATMRLIFKISYYETKLENRKVNISKVKNMAWYKIWLN